MSKDARKRVQSDLGRRDGAGGGGIRSSTTYKEDGGGILHRNLAFDGEGVVGHGGHGVILCYTTEKG